MILLLLWIVLAVSVVHLCSLLETTLFCVGRRLLAIKQDRIDDAIGAILILNTVAGTAGSTLAGAQAARLFGEVWVGALSASLTLLLLVVSEIIPKTLAARHAGRLSGIVGHVLFYLIEALAPGLVLTRALVRLLARRPREHLTRRELAALIARAPREGAISAAESIVIGNFIYSRAVTLRDAMTPSALVFMMSAQQSVGDLIATPQAEAFSRIPVFGSGRQDVVGYVSHREALRAFAQDGDRSRKLETLLHAVPALGESTRVGEAVDRLLEQHEAIAVVMGPDRAPVGLVTLEDLLEAILGMEITDEADEISHLRQAVAQSRKRRAAELRRRRSQQGRGWE